jgi:hypothetical protein
MPAASDPIVRRIAGDESITRGLGDIEGRMLIEWVVGWAELFAEAAHSDADAESLSNRLCRRAKAINRFVQLWANPSTRGGAGQLAASERFRWPLPTDSLSSADLMEHVLAWENRCPTD